MYVPTNYSLYYVLSTYSHIRTDFIHLLANLLPIKEVSEHSTIFARLVAQFIPQLLQKVGEEGHTLDIFVTSGYKECKHILPPFRI